MLPVGYTEQIAPLPASRWKAGWVRATLYFLFIVGFEELEA